MSVIDFHAHAFPDAVAANAVPALEKLGDIKAVLDGTLGALRQSMDKADVERTVVASIATRPDHFDNIFAWSKSIADDRIVPFPSVHPEHPDVIEQIHRIADAGFRGVKMHPQYQNFVMTADIMTPIYRVLEETQLLLLLHTGFDPAYPRDRVADPQKTLQVHQEFPKLRLITSHFFAWDDWEEADKYLLGKPIYTDLSWSIGFMPPEIARKRILAHPKEYLLFGTDSPWADQKESIDFIRSLDLGVDYEEHLFYENAQHLLQS